MITVHIAKISNFVAEIINDNTHHTQLLKY